jgi:hypothetical protein
LLASFLVEKQDSLGQRIKALTRLGQQDLAALPAKEGHSQSPLQGADTLADGSLSQAQGVSGGREIAEFSRLRKGFQMGKLIRMHDARWGGD